MDAASRQEVGGCPPVARHRDGCRPPNIPLMLTRPLRTQVRELRSPPSALAARGRRKLDWTMATGLGTLAFLLLAGLFVGLLFLLSRSLARTVSIHRLTVLAVLCVILAAGLWLPSIAGLQLGDEMLAFSLLLVAFPMARAIAARSRSESRSLPKTAAGLSLPIVMLASFAGVASSHEFHPSGSSTASGWMRCGDDIVRFAYSTSRTTAADPLQLQLLLKQDCDDCPLFSRVVAVREYQLTTSIEPGIDLVLVEDRSPVHVRVMAGDTLLDDVCLPG